MFSMKFVLPLTVAALISGGAMTGCTQKAQPDAAREVIHTRAVAVLHPTKGSQVTGLVTFTDTGEGIKVVADVYGLTPGTHGFHVHEYGDCSAEDASTAGGHFNPANMPHGTPTDAKRHVGDLGNLEADSTGHAHYEWTDPMLQFGGAYSIIGRGVIVHGGADDLTSQPSGNAGPRVACGVIGIAKD